MPWYVGVIALGGLRSVTIQLVSNDHGNNLGLVFIMPDGTRYEVPGVNTPGSGPVVQFGDMDLDQMTCEFTDYTKGQVWTWPDTSHIHRSAISGADTRGPYTGYRYNFDDGGAPGQSPDGDFNDIIMDVKKY